MNKRILILAIMLIGISGCKEEKGSNTENADHNHMEQPVTDTEKKVLSPHTSAMAMIGGAHIHMDYSSPGVRGRIIFGGLLPFDEVWQAGAHMATWIETDKDLLINGSLLKKGKYGFFLIPSKEKDWTVIFNTNWDQHGKDEYNSDQDVLRTSIKPIFKEEITEHLVYEVKDLDDGNGLITMRWEKAELNIPFKIK